MVKAPLCDVCLTAGEVRQAYWRLKLRTSGLGVDLCHDHKHEKISDDRATDLILKAAKILNSAGGAKVGTKKGGRN